jgi:hypothetical protein
MRLTSKHRSSVNLKDKQPLDNQRHDRRRLVTASSSIFITLALALIGVLAFLVYGRRFHNALAPEVFNLSYQFLLIVVIGGAISLLYKEFSSERDRTQERRTLVRQMHSELLSSFNAAKRVRRTLRARVGCSFDRGPIQQLKVTAADYQEQMDLLMDAQLTFEVYAKRAKDRELFFARGEELGIECGKLRNISISSLANTRRISRTLRGHRPANPL